MQHPLQRICVGALAALALQAIAAAQTLTITVGSGPDCVFDNLEEAVATAHAVPAQERLILLERGSFHGVAVVSTTEQLTLRGGFDSCSDEQPTANGKTFLFGTADAPVVEVDQEFLPSPNDPPTLVLENVELTEGRPGLLVRSPARVRLENVSILGNEASAGGGIQVQAFPNLVDLELVRTSVNSNRTLPDTAVPHGGGLFCNGFGQIRIADGSSFVGNQTVATGEGGGIYLNGCDLRLEGDVDLRLNAAHRGGAIAAVDGASVRLLGDGTGVPELAFNRSEERDGAAGRGGAVYLAEDSFLETSAARFLNNRALPEFDAESGGQGGAVYLDGSSGLLARHHSPCPQPCLQLEANRAADGAALYVANGSDLEVFRGHFEANVADGAILQADSGDPGVNSSLRLVSCFLSRNVASDLMEVKGGSSLRLTHVSVGGNLSLGAVLRARDLSTVEVLSSVLFEPSADILNAGDSVAVEASCSLVSDDRFFLPDSVLEVDPQFLDAVTGDLHLEETSPAIDLCPVTTNLGSDIDGQPRFVDQEVVPDDGTPADAGADEVPFITPPEPGVFSDDFESGDFSAWSHVVE